MNNTNFFANRKLKKLCCGTCTNCFVRKIFHIHLRRIWKNKKGVGATDNNNKDIAQKTRNCLTFLRLLQIGVKK